MKGLFEPTWFIIMSAQVFIVPASNLNVNTIGISIWGDRAKQILLSHGSPFSIRMPVFWDTPTAPWLLIPVIHIRTQVKTRQTQSYKFWKIAKKILILQTNLHLQHLPKLLNKMYKYEMDPIRTVGDTERTQDAGWTDGWTDGWMDGQTDGVKPIYPPTTSLCGGYNNGNYDGYVRYPELLQHLRLAMIYDFC